MNVTKKPPPRKEAIRLRPTRDDGLNIQYCLKRKRHSFVSIGESLTVTPQTVALIVFGHRRSRRIESEIARVLGKADWNEVVLEARSEVQKKPVKVILREMAQRRKERAAEFAAGFAGALEQARGGA